MLTKSQMLELGTEAPGFSLNDVASGEMVEKSNYEGRPLLVVFMCVHCPYVKHVEEEIAKIGRDYENQIGMVAVSANDVNTHPEDAPEEMKRQAEKLQFTFPYVYDETQEMAKAYAAACTPDFFLFDSGHKLAYRGRLDGARPEKFLVKVTGSELRAAIEAVLKGNKPTGEQKPSMGCNIKWK